MQISIFDGSKQLKITKPIRLVELFAGIGSQAKALERLNANFEHYRVVEFDKYAIRSYNAIHNTNFPTMDITQIHANDLGIVDTDKYDYIMTYSFPCTDLSKAGKQQGMSKNSGTRSGLLWEVERLLKEMKELPQFLLMENVPDVLSDKFIKDFASWITFLDSLGYTSKWAVMNSKDYGIPQNRNRCFMLSWLEKDCYYYFPKPERLTIRLKDLLEKEVDEKYYLSDNMVAYFTQHSEEMKAKGNGFRFTPMKEYEADTAKTITTRAGSRMDDNFISCFDHNTYIAEPSLIQVGQLECNYESSGRVYSIDGLSPTINTCGGGNREVKIKIKSATKKGYEEAHIYDSVTLDQPNSATSRGRVGKQVSQTLLTLCNIGVVEPIIYDDYNARIKADQSCINTLTTNCGNDAKRNGVKTIEPISCAMRGRNPDNPSDRTAGIPTEQRIELGGDVSNCLTTVQKDSLVAEQTIIDDTYGFENEPRKYTETCPTLRSGKQGLKVKENYRIRKLTPKECFRLMDFDDIAYERASAVNSKTQLYKQAGNSIVVACLVKIFEPLL